VPTRPDEIEELVRSLAPHVLAGMLRRGEEFAAAEDALQDAVVEALRVWPEHLPRDPRAWLSAVAVRRLVDARRSESARRVREQTVALEQTQGPTEHGDDALLLLFLCCHPELSAASQVALTLRAVAGLTTREIAEAFFVPEATMAQRISRAKRTLRGRDFRELGDLAVVLRVLSLIYHAGHGRRHDLTREAIRLTRQLTLATPEPEARGLLALMLLQHARLPARTDAAGRLVTLDEQDRSLWNTTEITEAVDILQGALANQNPGRYQVLAAIAALHDDARTSADTDWPQILAWYDDLVGLSDDPDNDDPAAVLNRAVAVGHVRGAPAGLAETERVRPALAGRAQWHAVRAYLHELGGELAPAAEEYAAAARAATEIIERDHLVRRAARARARLAGRDTGPQSHVGVAVDSNRP
jgi:RNA polymerase sigma factor (sigma-70 family)